MNTLTQAALLSAAVIAASTSIAVSAAPPAAKHPLIGKWTIISRDGKCTESYLFRADGTATITSGEEVSETEYAVSDTASANGFYKFGDRVMKDNGKKDCGGNVMKVGDVDSSYVQFDPKGELVIMCETPSLDKCFGPLVRERAK